MAPPPVFRPENTLKRADELISVGEPQAAVEGLYEFLTNRRTRYLEPSSVEIIVLKLTELAVDLKKGRLIKDALFQYKKNVQSTPEGLNSLGSVCRKFISYVEQKLAQEEKEEAEKEAASPSEEDDLEEITSLNLLYSAASEKKTGEDGSESTEDESVPLLKFTWESYRVVLDLLRNNSQLEITYSGVVNRAMSFCLKYNRKSEFKRLNDMLRQHLDHANYHQKNVSDKNTIVNLTETSTMERYLEQRFHQLDVSVKLKLWHEAFRSIEDVHQLLKMNSNLSPKASFMAAFYENISKTLVVSGNYLLNAVALIKFYKLYQKNPNATEADFKHYSSLIFMACLAVPDDELPTVGFDPQLRLCSLLDLEGKPNRKELFEYVLQEDVYRYVDEELKQLHLILNDFHSSDITTLKENLKTKVTEDLMNKPFFQDYSVALRDYIIRKIYVSVSNSHESIKTDELYEFVQLPKPFDLSPFELSNLLMQIALDDYISFTLDQETEIITFNNDPYELIKETVVDVESEASDDESDDESDDDDDEEEEKSKVDAEKVENEEREAKPRVYQSKYISELKDRMEQLTFDLKEQNQAYDESKSYMEKVRLIRNKMIENENEIIEAEQREAQEQELQLEEQREEEKRERARQQEIAHQEREKRRIEEKLAEEQVKLAEAERRAEEKEARERKEMELAMVKELINTVNKKGLIKIDLKKAKDYTLEQVKKMDVEAVEKDQKEVFERSNVLFKRVDHLERAIRENETPVLKKELDEKAKKNLEEFNKFKAQLIESSQVEYNKKMELHQRLNRLNSDYLSLKNNLINERLSKFQEAKAAKLNELKRTIFEKQALVRKEELDRAEDLQRREAEEKAKEAQLAQEMADRIRKLEEAEKAEKAQEVQAIKDKLAELETKLNEKGTFSAKMKMKKERAALEGQLKIKEADLNAL